MEGLVISVFDPGMVFGRKIPQGFTPHTSTNDYASRVTRNLLPMRRADAERSLAYLQPIPYVLLVDEPARRVFTYQRSSQGVKLDEEALRGKWSIGVGGHMSHDPDSQDPIRTSITQKMSGEVNLEGRIEEPRLLGYLWDPSCSLGKVHFGMLYVAQMNGSVAAKDPGITNGGMKGLSKVNALRTSTGNSRLEGWSELALTPLRKYFENK